jgi:metal-sulfur cluster biosynthetic enzyme
MNHTDCKDCPLNGKCPIQASEERMELVRAAATEIKMRKLEAATIARIIERSGKKALYGTDHCSEYLKSHSNCFGCEGAEGCEALVRVLLESISTILQGRDNRGH